jgi:DNA-directed RNA polymerase beta subunit
MRKVDVVAKTEGQRIPSCSDKFVPERTRKRLQHLVAPHVESFNYFLDSGLSTAIEDILPLEVSLIDGPFIRIKVESMSISNPSKSDDYTDGKLTPREARERGLSYSSPMIMHFVVEVFFSVPICYIILFY